MGHDHIIRELHDLEAKARTSLSSLHAPRRPIIDAYKHLIKLMEDEAVEGDHARHETLRRAGLHADLEWPDGHPDHHEEPHKRSHHKQHHEEHGEDHSPKAKFVEGFTRTKAE